MSLFNWIQQDWQLGILLIVALMFALTLHEFGHAYLAYLCGDSTAKYQGRMSINPFVHLDVFGSLMLLFVGIGYAKPVPVDPRNFRYRNAHLYISAAGPGMNLLLALLGGILVHVLSFSGTLNQDMLQFLFIFMIVNMSLCLFNLIPLGPLDGSYVFPYLLPQNTRRKYILWNMQYGTYAILGLLLITVFWPASSPLAWISQISRTFVRTLIG